MQSAKLETYWEFERYRGINEMRFDNQGELDSFRKLFGYSLKCDPLLVHYIVDKQVSFLKFAIDSVLQRNITAASGHLSVLEVGCGTAYKIGNLSSLFGFRGFGCDVSEKVIEFDRTYCQGMDFFVHDVRTPFETTDQFDIVFTCMLLQHISDKKGALKNIRDVLKPNGFFIFVEECYDYLPMKKHLSYGIDREEYIYLLNACGFEILHIGRALEVPWFYLLFPYSFSNSSYDPAHTVKRDFTPVGLKMKPARMYIKSIILWNRWFYSRFNVLRNSRILNRYLNPLIEIGVVAQSRA